MNDLSAAAGASQNAANWSSQIAQRIWEKGIEIELDVPDEVRTKLLTIPGVGKLLVELVDAIDDIEVKVRLGQ